jgi:hypothetical protein
MKTIREKEVIITDDNKVIGYMKLKTGEVIDFTIEERGKIKNNGNDRTDKVVLPFLNNLVDMLHNSTE